MFLCMSFCANRKLIHTSYNIFQIDSFYSLQGMPQSCSLLTSFLAKLSLLLSLLLLLMVLMLPLMVLLMPARHTTHQVHRVDPVEQQAHWAPGTHCCGWAALRSRTCRGRVKRQMAVASVHNSTCEFTFSFCSSSSSSFSTSVWHFWVNATEHRN